MSNKYLTEITLLALILSKKVSTSSLRDFLKNYNKDHESILDALDIAKASINASYSAAVEAIESGLKNDIHPIAISDDKYPRALTTISDAPLILYARGNLSALKMIPGIAVVGTRKATSHGITIAERVSHYIGEQGIPVVSGLALGIDAAAHEGALRSPTPTIAVLAHGLEKASPRANAHLADRILDNGGLWVSEHPCGVGAKPEYFVQRNRIQVGLSSASIIVEGEEKSGSMTQAEYCIRNRRVLAAVLPDPGGLTSTQHMLPKMLVSNRGAFPIRSKLDYPTFVEMAISRRNEIESAGAAQ